MEILTFFLNMACSIDIQAAVLHVNMTEAPSLCSHHISADCDLVSPPQSPTSHIL